MIIFETETTLTPKSPKNNKEKTKVEKIKSGPQNYTVFTKKLVTEAPNSKDIISNHGAFFKEVDEFTFQGLVLGYVTPVCYLFYYRTIIIKSFFSGIIMDMILQKYLAINSHILVLCGCK